MIKSIKTIMRQDREPYRVPRRVQDVIPIQCVWPDGIFKVGIKFSKTYRFTDINYKVASREDKETMFLAYSELLNGLDSAATTKLTICNRRQSQADFEQSVLMAMRGDGLDKYRQEYNQMLIDKATGANGIIQEKLVTVTVYKRDIEDARAYFTRIGADLTARFAALGSKCVELDAADRLRMAYPPAHFAVLLNKIRIEIAFHRQMANPYQLQYDWDAGNYQAQFNVGKIACRYPHFLCQCPARHSLSFPPCPYILSKSFKTGTIFDVCHITSPKHIV